MKRLNYILAIIIIILICFIAYIQAITKESFTEKLAKEFLFDKLTKEVATLKIPSDTNLKVIKDQKIVIICKTKKIRHLEKNIDSLYALIKLADESNSLNVNDLNTLEDSINKLSYLKEQKAIEYFEILDSITFNPGFMNAKNRLKDWQNKNSKLRNIINEIKNKTFKLTITGQRTLNNHGVEIRIARKIQFIEIYFKITGCVISKQQIFADFLDPQGNRVRSKRWGRNNASFIKDIDLPINDTLRFSVDIRKGGDYMIVFKTSTDMILEKKSITIYE